MKNQKFFYLLFFCVGIIFGGAAIYIYIQQTAEKNNRSNFFSSAKKQNHIEKDSQKTIKYKSQQNTEKQEETIDTLSTRKEKQESPDEVVQNQRRNDSVQTFSPDFFEEKTEVAHDELIKIIFLDLPVRNNNKQDSLLINDKTPEIKHLTIEFWISPINYTGYQMNKSKLILFGIKQPEKASFELLEQGKLLLKYKDSNIVLEYTDDFRPLRLNNK